MAISKERKEELVRQYVERLQASQGMILVDYRGLRVGDMEQLRRSLRGSDVVFRVVKNRLLGLALGEMGVEMPQQWLEGPTAVAFCHSEVPAAAKVLSDFSKEAALLSIKGGVLGTSIMAVEQVKALAALPPREILLAQMLGTINAPASQVAGVVAGGIRQVLNVLQAHTDKLSSESPAPQAA